MYKVEVYRRIDGKFDWNLVSPNGEIMCGSIQGYTERGDAREGFVRVETALSDPALHLEIVEVG